jgi:hypothetical protein
MFNESSFYKSLYRSLDVYIELTIGFMIKKDDVG